MDLFFLKLVILAATITLVALVAAGVVLVGLRSNRRQRIILDARAEREARQDDERRSRRPPAPNDDEGQFKASPPA